MSYQAYKKVQQAIDSPSQTEYRLFAQVTRSLQEAASIKRTDPNFIKALDWNRRLWSTLSTDCGLPGNQLPDQLRASIVSLAIWVSKHTTQVARGQASIDALINVNRTVMVGLENQIKKSPETTSEQETDISG